MRSAETWIPLAELERHGLLRRRPEDIADARLERIVRELEILSDDMAEILTRHRTRTAELRAELAHRASAA